MADHKQALKLPLMVRLKILVATFFSKCVIRGDGTINRRLYSLLNAKTSAGTTTITERIAVSSSDITVDPSRDLWFRIFVPSATDKMLPLIVYFHGGGFSLLNANFKPVDDFCRTLAVKLPAIVASVNYRLAPEHQCPCQYDDGFDALKHINDKTYEILPSNTDLERCFLFGDSAGANIAHHLAVKAGQDRRALHKIKLAGVVAVQPFFGGEERTEAEVRFGKMPMLTVEVADAMWRRFLPAGANRNHPAVNVFGGGDEYMRSVEFPATLVVVGGFDPLQDWQRKYVRGLEKCGKEVELIEYGNALHGFYYFRELPEFELLFEDVKRFIKKH